jgi:hypothetical protein
MTWVQLANSTGNEIGGVFKVPHGGDVGDFKEKVKEKSPNDLALIDAYRLTVYANRGSFPNQHLLPFAALGQHGEDGENPIWVVVPVSRFEERIWATRENMSWFLSPFVSVGSSRYDRLDKQE